MNHGFSSRRAVLPELCSERRAPVAAVLALGALAGCAVPTDASDWTVLRSELESSFDSWCADWSLDCSEMEARDIPEGAPWSAEQWDVLAGVAASALQSPSEFVVTRAELDDPELAEVLTSLTGGTESYAAVLDALDDAAWQSLSKASSETFLRGSSGQTNRYTLPSGLVVEADAESQIRVASPARVDVSGIQLGSTALPETLTPLTGLRVERTNYAVLEFGEDSVSDVPAVAAVNGLLQGLLGDTDLSFEADVETLVEIAEPLLGWLNTKGRRVWLEREFFETAGRGLPTLLGDSEYSDLFVPVVESTNSLTTSVPGGESILKVNFVPGSRLLCKHDRLPIEVTIDNEEFLVRGIRQASGGMVSLDVTGLNVALRLFRRLRLQPSQIDVTSEKFIIQGVPVVGSYEVPFEELKSVTCTHSGS